MVLRPLVARSGPPPGHLPPRGPLRRYLAQHVAHELFTLPSVCDTDAVMTAWYATGSGLIRRTWRPTDRRRAAL